MAITTLASWVPTMDEFAAHWDLVNTELGAEMVLQGGYTRANFITDRDALEAKIIEIVGLMNVAQMADSTRDTVRVAARDRLRQFRAQVQTLLPGTPYESAMPKLPPDNSGEGVLVGALDDAAHLWTQINADTTTPGFTPPLVVGSYVLATFQTDVQAVRDAFKAVRDADKNLEVERDRRDALLDPARERMRQYQTGVEANLPAGHALLDSVPLLSPAPGSTPDAVTLSGMWDAGTLEAVLTWTESSEANFDHYDVRMTPGATYDTANDVSIFSVGAGTLEHRTQDGLLNPGDTASFKVYVVLRTGNEAGSNTVTITHP